MNISLSKISKYQTDIIKGFAISLIVFHNLLNHTNELTHLEMSFVPGSFMDLFSSLKKSPVSVFNYLLTYLGHYGVQLFIFISGYGLSKKYASVKSIPYKPFITNRLSKIYKLLIFGIFIYTVIFVFIFKAQFFNKQYLLDIILTITTLRNLTTDTLFCISGPWWFFGLIIQLYLLFPLLFFIMKKFGLKSFIFLLIICYAGIFITTFLYDRYYEYTPFYPKYDFAFYGNFTGHLPEFIAGMAFAMFPVLKINDKIIGGASIVFLLSNLYRPFFSFSYLSITIILLWVCYLIFRYSPEIILKGLYFTGTISMFMFLFNAAVRNVYRPKILDLSPLQTTIASFLHFIIVIIFSYSMMILFNKLNRIKLR